MSTVIRFRHSQAVFTSSEVMWQGDAMCRSCIHARVPALTSSNNAKQKSGDAEKMCHACAMVCSCFSRVRRVLLLHDLSSFSSLRA